MKLDQACEEQLDFVIDTDQILYPGTFSRAKINNFAVFSPSIALTMVNQKIRGTLSNAVLII